MIKVDDDLLYKYMPEASENHMNQIPPEKELDHKFSKRFERKMKTLLKYEKRTPFMRSLVSYSRKTAAIFLVSISIAFALTMSVEAYRIKFFEIVTTVWEDFTSFIYKSDSSTDNDKLILIEPPYVPEGFYVEKSESSKYKYTIIYQNPEGREIYYVQKLLTQSETIIDTEDAMYEVIKIGDQDITILQNKGSVLVQWADSYNSYSILSTLDVDELVKMAESIINKK